MPTGIPGSGPYAKKPLSDPDAPAKEAAAKRAYKRRGDPKELAVTRLSNALAQANVDLAERLVQLNRAEAQIESLELAATALRTHNRELEVKINDLDDMNDQLGAAAATFERRLGALLDLIYKTN